MNDKCMQKVVDKVAHWYSARSWWADLNDLKQEAWVAVLESRRTYNPELGAEEPHARKAAWYRVRDYLWTHSAPVTGRKHHGECLRGMHRAPLTSLVRHTAYDPMEDPEIELWWAEMSQIVRQVVRSGHNGEIAERVLIHREKPAAIAAALGCPIHRVHRASSDARKRVKNDMELRYAMAHSAQTA